jgi:hypothetical protein
MAPPKYSSFSVSVVLPASGCEMIAKVRRGSMDEPRGAGRSRSVAVIGFRSARKATIRQNRLILKYRRALSRTL